MIFEEITIDVKLGAVVHDYMLPNLRPGCLESPVKSQGILRYNHGRGKARVTCGDARHNRNVFQVPRYSMGNVASTDADRNHNFLRFSIFPVGYPNFIKIKYKGFQQGVASADGLNWAPNHIHPCMHGSFLWIMYQILFLTFVHTARKIDFCSGRVRNDVPPERPAQWISDQSACFSP
jgi:hypothetical protein